jgi:hypothetical protein
MLQDYITYAKNARRMDRNLIFVENHVTDIPERLKAEVDPDFFVMFNPGTQKFEIHKKVEYGVTLELNLPYNELDYRAIIVAQNSRDVQKVREEIEAHNAKLDDDKKKVLDNEKMCKAKDIYDYAYHHESKEKPDEGAFKTKFV